MVSPALLNAAFWCLLAAAAAAVHVVSPAAAAGQLGARLAGDGLATTPAATTATPQGMAAPTLNYGALGLTGPLPPALDAMTALTFLWLPANVLSGPVSAGLSSLQALTWLQLANNALTSTLPAEWSALQELRNMHLYSNQLEGQLPGQWAQGLAKIQDMRLHNNRLTAELPGSWSALTSLTRLSLENNLLRGAVPDWSALGLLTVYLSLAPGNLGLCADRDGSSDATIAKCAAPACPLTVCPPSFDSSSVTQQLVDLGWLTGTRFDTVTPLGQTAVTDIYWGESSSLTGTLPTVLPAFALLTGLEINYQTLSSTLPASWSSWTHVKQIKLSRDGLTGTLPVAWSLLSELEMLHINEQGLTGQLPSQYSALVKLRDLHFASNPGIGGPLPVAYSQLTALTDLDLSYCAFSSTIPEAWSSLQSLTYAWLQANKLSGSIPSWLAGVASIMDISNNELLCKSADGSSDAVVARCSCSSFLFCGEPPAPKPDRSLTHQLFSLGLVNANGTVLTPLGAVHTEISITLSSLSDGTIPPAVADMPLVSFYATLSALSGPLPGSWSPTLKTLNLAYTKLSGTLSPQYSTLTNLSVLSLVNAKVFGPLPTQFSVLPKIQQLWLAKNRLSGTLPPQWSAMSTLIALDLGSNAIVGELPVAWGGGMPSLASIHLSDNQIGGPLVTSWMNIGASAPSTLEKTVRLDRNRLTGTIPSEWSEWALGSLYLNSNSLAGPIPPLSSSMAYDLRRNAGLCANVDGSSANCTHWDVLSCAFPVCGSALCTFNTYQPCSVLCGGGTRPHDPLPAHLVDFGCSGARNATCNDQPCTCLNHVCSAPRRLHASASILFCPLAQGCSDAICCVDPPVSPTCLSAFVCAATGRQHASNAALLVCADHGGCTDALCCIEDGQTAAAANGDGGGITAGSLAGALVVVVVLVVAFFLIEKKAMQAKHAALRAQTHKKMEQELSKGLSLSRSMASTSRRGSKMRKSASGGLDSTSASALASVSPTIEIKCEACNHVAEHVRGKTLPRLCTQCGSDKINLPEEDIDEEEDQ